jgi:hypothetical protein
MYQILNSTPVAASLRNPELPEVVDLIVAKALNKNMEERYQSARDLAQDLLDCKKMLQGRAAVLAKLPTEQRGEPPAPGATRRQDKILPIKSATMKVADAAASKPALTLAKGFDSYEATMRLAAMTGMDQELTGFDSDADTEVDVASSTTPVRPVLRTADPARRAEESSGGSYTWLWIVSSVVALIAVALFLWR